MIEPIGQLNFPAVGERNKSGGARSPKIGVIEGAIGGPDRLASLSALFPHVDFASAGVAWPEGRAAKFDVLIAAVDAASAANLEHVLRQLKGRSPNAQIVVVLSNADVVSTRRLLREGAADVLPAPVGEPALAVSIERLLAANPALNAGAPRSGEVVAFLKAGGGVGATSIAVQIAARLASRAEGQVCFTDLDLQFGCGSIYLDMPEALTVSDVMSSIASLEDTPFGTALATHKSGLRIMAAPREITPLEALSAQMMDSLVTGLKRDFPLTIVDLPSVWTAWTNRILQLSDRIVLVTKLSVPHMHLVKRQLRIIASQGLDDHPLTVVINGVTAERQAQVSLKAAERALGRSFDMVIPEDQRTMNVAINEGLQLSAVKRGTRLEKAIAELADKLASGALAQQPVKATR